MLINQYLFEDTAYICKFYRCPKLRYICKFYSCLQLSFISKPSLSPFCKSVVSKSATSSERQFEHRQPTENNGVEQSALIIMAITSYSNCYSGCCEPMRGDAGSGCACVVDLLRDSCTFSRIQLRRASG